MNERKKIVKRKKVGFSSSEENQAESSNMSANQVSKPIEEGSEMCSQEATQQQSNSPFTETSLEIPQTSVSTSQPNVPVTQAATVSTVVTTVNKNCQPELNSMELPANTLQTTVVTMVGALPSNAGQIQTSSVAAVPFNSVSSTQNASTVTPLASVPNESSLLETTQESVLSVESPKAKNAAKVDSKHVENLSTIDALQNENQHLKTVLKQLESKRAKLKSLTSQMETERERQIQLLNKYRQFLVCTFESIPMVQFKEVIRKITTPTISFGMNTNGASTPAPNDHLEGQTKLSDDNATVVCHSDKNITKISASASAAVTLGGESSRVDTERPAIDTAENPSDFSEDSVVHRELEDSQKRYPNEWKQTKKDTDWKQSSGSSGKTRSNLWTPEEDRLFMKAFKQYGTRWKYIQKVLPNKSRQQIQSHGAYLIRLGKLNKQSVKAKRNENNSEAWQDESGRNNVCRDPIDTYEGDPN